MTAADIQPHISNAGALATLAFQNVKQLLPLWTIGKSFIVCR